MFKKALKVSSHNVLAGKDKKSLKKELSTVYDPDSIENFFETNDKLYCDKLQGSKILIYSTEKYPAIIDSTGKGAYFPTLYLLQEYPIFTKKVNINPGVENFLMKGANLMWPGVKNQSELGDFKADDVRVVIDDKGKTIAIGAMACSSEDLKSNKNEGIAVYVLHLVDDKLWELGPKIQLDIVFPNPKQIKKEEVKQENDDDEDEDEEDDEDLLENLAHMVKKNKVQDDDDNMNVNLAKDKKKKPAEIVESKPKAKPKEEKLLEKGKDFSDDEDDDKRKKGKKKGKGGAKPKEKEQEKEKPKDNKKGKKKPQPDSDNENEDSESEQTKEKPAKKQKETKENKESDNEEAGPSDPTIPPKIMDEYIYESFMNALKMSVTEKDLPMDPSVFYLNHMLLCKKETIVIDLKNSTYKKIGKFFQTMAKLGLIDYKEAKKGSAPQISKINRTHEKYEQWETTIGKVGTKKIDEEKKDNEEKWPKVSIEDLYKPKDSIKKLFDNDKKLDGLYTMEEAKARLQDYLKKNEIKMEKKFLILDPYLLSLFPHKEPVEEIVAPVEEEKKIEGDEGAAAIEEKKKKVKKNVVHSDYILKDELFARFFDEYLLKWHKITNLQTTKTEIKAGSFKGVTITAEKAHNKNITKVIGLEQFGFDLTDLSSKFQLKFACSVSVHELPGKNMGKEFVVHGNFLQDITDYLTGECKVDQKYITSHNKLEKKKK